MVWCGVVWCGGVGSCEVAWGWVGLGWVGVLGGECWALWCVVGSASDD